MWFLDGVGYRVLCCQIGDEPIDPHEHVVKDRRPVVALKAGKDLDSMCHQTGSRSEHVDTRQ